VDFSIFKKQLGISIKILFGNIEEDLVCIIKKFKLLIFTILVGIFIPVSAWGVSGLGCIGATVAEYLIPGLGYGILGHYDKMLVLGGSRWIAINKYWHYSSSDDYEQYFNKIYKKTDLADDQKQHDYFYSRETYYANVYLSMYGNLTFVSFYDLYETGCEKNSQTFGLMLSPFQVWEYADEWTFWIPTIWASTVSLDSDLVTYHVDNDLSKNEIINTSFLQYQLVGVGEEMLFRGVIQKSLFNLFSTGVSKGYSRWGSIITASAIFGAAHSGAGFTASPEIAFVAGMYLGMVFHPADGDFDLTQSIAIHSWWDTILAHRRLKDAKFVERKSGENALNYNLQERRIYPLLGLSYYF